MTNTQIVRLRQDVEELQFFVKRLEKEGEKEGEKTSLLTGEKTRISLIQSKIKFVQDTISRLEESTATQPNNTYIC